MGESLIEKKKKTKKEKKQQQQQPQTVWNMLMGIPGRCSVQMRS